MTILKQDRPRPIDRVIDFFGEPRRILAGGSTPPPSNGATVGGARRPGGA